MTVIGMRMFSLSLMPPVPCLPPVDWLPGTVSMFLSLYQKLLRPHNQITYLRSMSLSEIAI